MAEDLFAKGIGIKEGQKSLEAKPIMVQGKLAESVLGKVGSKNAGKEVGKKLTLICKHPDREEPIKISEMTFVAGKIVKTSTMWINIDEDGSQSSEDDMVGFDILDNHAYNENLLSIIDNYIKECLKVNTLLKWFAAVGNDEIYILFLGYNNLYSSARLDAK